MRLPDFIRRRLLHWAFRVMDSRKPDFIIGEPDRPYIHRWHVRKAKWFSIYLHDIKRSDDDRALHDHPASNASAILAGGYVEVLSHDGSVRYRRRTGDILFRRAEMPHRLIIGDYEPGAITIWIKWRDRRTWGFYTLGGERWVPWQEFCDPINPGLARKGEP